MSHAEIFDHMNMNVGASTHCLATTNKCLCIELKTSQVRSHLGYFFTKSIIRLEVADLKMHKKC